jgi:hypothetical protein
VVVYLIRVIATKIKKALEMLIFGDSSLREEVRFISIFSRMLTTIQALQKGCLLSFVGPGIFAGLCPYKEPG